jgi:hypothetical protein
VIGDWCGSGDCPTRFYGVLEHDMIFEVTSQHGLNAQSPSRRWDGDCALSIGMFDIFVRIVCRRDQGFLSDSRSIAPSLRALEVEDEDSLPDVAIALVGL